MYQRSNSYKSYSPAGNNGRRFNSFSPRGRGGRSAGPRLDISKFINKAKPLEEMKYVSVNSFNDFNINPKLKENIKRKGFEAPLPIQDQAIPHLLEGRDLIGLANTGTGKTIAFLIPLINKMLSNNTEKALIVAPTRELAVQIEDELRELTYQLHIYSVSCIGGAYIGKQITNLRRSHNFVIGTPGRLVDLIERGVLNLSGFRNIVLDEVDRMLDMGFSKDILYLIRLMPRDKQSMFFSATIDPKITAMINQYSMNPVTVSVKTRDTAASVDQDVVRVADKSKKFEVLQDLLNKDEFKRTLIFGETKHGVQKLTYELIKQGLKAECIHGNKSQSQRQRALDMFKDGKVDILVATDVAARGLDIPEVSHVINYEIPRTYEDYIHRIGRTGRANNKGSALTFV